MLATHIQLAIHALYHYIMSLIRISDRSMVQNIVYGSVGGNQEVWLVVGA